MIIKKIQILRFDEILDSGRIYPYETNDILLSMMRDKTKIYGRIRNIIDHIYRDESHHDFIHFESTIYVEDRTLFADITLLTKESEEIYNIHKEYIKFKPVFEAIISDQNKVIIKRFIYLDMVVNLI